MPEPIKCWYHCPHIDFAPIGRNRKLGLFMQFHIDDDPNAKREKGPVEMKSDFSLRGEEDETLEGRDKEGLLPASSAAKDAVV